MPMRRTLLLLAVALGIANTGAEFVEWRAAVYVAKPLAMLLLTLLVLTTRPASRYRDWIAAGLLASLAGDILLMLPQGRFVPGLVAFLIAHLCYIVAFTADGATGRATLLPALVVYAFASVVLASLWQSLGTMRAPVTAYVAVISTMSWTAITRWRIHPSLGTALAAAGSLCFLLSDSSLAFRKFVAPFPGATLGILGTYYLAQWGIALSVTDEARVR